MSKQTSLQCCPLAICLMGPTASGKTELAMALRKFLPVDIVSVDSALIYRGMDIGTAKPSAVKLATTWHRLIDIRDPAESYSAADFRRDALKEMSTITNNNRIPLLVGGTMLYFQALIDGLSPLPSADTMVRMRMQLTAKKIGWPALHQKLQQIDPIAAQRIHPHDSHRLSRALEVFYITGKTLTELRKIPGEKLAYQVHQFALAPLDFSLLYQRIEQRFHQMLAAGFEYEVSKLFARSDLNRNMPSIRCVGYRQMWSYLAGETDYNYMVSRVLCATKKLAKHQRSWLRRWRDIHWLDSEETTIAIERILQVISTSVS